MQSFSSCVCCGCGDKILSVAGDFMKIIFDEMDLRSLEVIEIARQLLSFFDRCDNCDCEGCPECNFLGVVQVRNADGTEFG